MKIVVITGPTGVGKTKLSISLAKYLDAVIINGDSMQVYQGMDIGTAKIKEKEKEGGPHYLFDISTPLDDYNIYKYQQDGRKLLLKFQEENRNVIIVGGSGLYLKSLLYDYRFQEELISETYDDLSNEEILKEIKKHYEIPDCLFIQNRQHTQSCRSHSSRSSCGNGNLSRRKRAGPRHLRFCRRRLLGGQRHGKRRNGCVYAEDSREKSRHFLHPRCVPALRARPGIFRQRRKTSR